MIRELFPEETILVNEIHAEFTSILDRPEISSLEPLAFDHLWAAFIESGMGGLFVYYDSKDKRPLGAIGGVLTPNHLDGILGVTELLWYVLQEARGNNVGMLLLNTLEKWAIKRGAKRIYMNHMLGFGPDLGEVYKQRGYTPFETCYIKVL